ncbi:MAG: hypothetical protein ACRD0K_29565, partial [Egibacteraceae bacterium]
YKTLEESRGTRGYPERFVAPPPAMVSWMLHGHLRRMLCAKLGIHDEGLSEDLFLVSDHGGYALGPHTDSPSKVLNVLFYLPADESTMHAGTSLYEPIEAGRTCPGGPHYPAADFREVKRVPFKPNSALIFAKSDTSFHGVERFVGPGTRSLLLYSVYKQ